MLCLVWDHYDSMAHDIHDENSQFQYFFGDAFNSTIFVAEAAYSGAVATLVMAARAL